MKKQITLAYLENLVREQEKKEAMIKKLDKFIKTSVNQSIE